MKVKVFGDVTNVKEGDVLRLLFNQKVLKGETIEMLINVESRLFKDLSDRTTFRRFVAILLATRKGPRFRVEGLYKDDLIERRVEKDGTTDRDLAFVLFPDGQKVGPKLCVLEDGTMTRYDARKGVDVEPRKRGITLAHVVNVEPVRHLDLRPDV